MILAQRKTIQDLNALSTAYGEAVGKKEYIADVFLPGLTLAVLGLITLEWWVPILLFIVGAVYGYKKILPQDVQRSYWLASIAERGRYMNVAAQIATNPEKSMLMVLRESTDRLNHDGELYKELTSLTARLNLMDVSPESVRPEFQKLIKKYSDDVNFALFLEQIETGVINGNGQVSTLVEIERYHRETRDVTEAFMKDKDMRKNDLKVSVALAWFIVGLFISTIGIGEYLRLMHTYYVGMVFNALFILSQLLMFNRFNRFYWDDDVTSVGDVKNKQKKKDKEEVDKERAKELKDMKKRAKKAKRQPMKKIQAKNLDRGLEQAPPNEVAEQNNEETIQKLLTEAKQAGKKRKNAKKVAKGKVKVVSR